MLALLACLFSISASSQTTPVLHQLSPAGLWQTLEFRIDNLPAVSNPFDPAVIKVDAGFVLPSGRTVIVPAFWYQNYQRALSGGSESLNAVGGPEWRLRFVPPEPGAYSVSVTVLTNSQSAGPAFGTNFTVGTQGPAGRFGYVQIAPGRQYFQTGDGQPLKLIGENVCWPGNRGTFDYDSWFGAMQNAGENYARMWMCPWWLGIETDSNSLTHYRLDRAWQLDYVLHLAEQRGIYLLLCLDYHGMFEVTPDYWGGGNYWPANPYNATNGGPCLNQNGFFTNSIARTIYQKRLRYLTARYGCSQNLLAWQFLNEIDNEYAYLVPSDVAAWHGVMGTWLHANDPFSHLVTTSLTGGSDRPEIWSISALDFAAYHSYGEVSPASRLSYVVQSFLQRYQKPALVDEFGTDWRGWNRTNDPYLRGFRQGLWGGALSGSVGTSMSWWWQNIDSENVYPVYTSMGKILNRTGWATGAWTNIGFVTSGPPPTTVGNVLTGTVPFSVSLPLDGTWGSMAPGRLAVPNVSAADYSASTFNCFVHGVAHANFKTPFFLSAWFTNAARLVMHLNSVSSGSTMVVRADGAELFRTNLPNLDGGYAVNNEYNMDIPVNLPAGKRIIEITNAGVDWFYLDWVRLEQALPALYSSNWQPSCQSIGVRGSREALVYSVAPGVSFPAGATNSPLPLQHLQTLVLTNWPAGRFVSEWYDPATSSPLGFSGAVSSNGVLVLNPPDFTEDIAGLVYPPPTLALATMPSNSLQLRLDSEPGGRYVIEQTTDLTNWSAAATLTNSSGTLFWTLPQPGDRDLFFRATKAP
ncbi:MAG TPA: DUF5060 domain-containing protein [Verrucomicrobiae bacterium]|nr:DUF5060 domain-containing protein [Verrucomicrobiae bacterium]